VLNIPDTVGYATPGEYAQLLRYLRTELFTEDEGVPEGITLAAHTHNDLGLAVANALAGLGEGARQVEVSVNGIGERAGNAALEEVVMLLETRRDALGYEHQINTFEIARTSRLVARHVDYPVAPNKAVVGRNAFAHESGIHQDGILKERSTYEIMDPRAIGLDSNEIVLGKHSGRHALADAYRKLGYKLSGEQLRRLFADFKEPADRKKRITLLDLEALLGDQLRAGGEIDPRAWTLSAGSGRVPRAEVIIADAGCERRAAAEGDGPIDAVLAALASALGTQAELKHFEAQGVDEGSEALAEAGVVVEEKGRRASGQATAPDTVEAAARAYLRAVFALSHSA